MKSVERIDRYLAGRVATLAAAETELPRGRYRLELIDAPAVWVVDFDDGPALSQGDAPNRMRLRATDLERTIDDPLHSYVLGWQQRISLEGDREQWEHVSQILFPSAHTTRSRHAGLYASIARLLPDPELEFMNLGLPGPETENFWQPCLNLLEDTLQGIDLAGKDVIDIGCGRGGSALHLARTRRTARITGLDYCRDNIAICTAREVPENATFLAASADSVPLPDASFDIPLNVESAHCYRSLPAFFAEVDRLLRRGGVFAFTDTFTPKTLARAKAALDARPWSMCRVADISDGVANALASLRDAMRDFFLSMLDLRRSNQALIFSLIDNYSEEFERRYRARELIYHSWQLET